MNITEYSLTRKTVSYLTMVLVIGGGLITFKNLGRLEDPEFTIKDAIIYTAYPGASPIEVEEEVTDLIETAVQRLPQLDELKSESKDGLSIVTVSINPKYNKRTLPQVWDELRRKINDVQTNLPPGAGPSVVNDDFGDVYGILFAIYGDGFTYAELKDYADFVRDKLLLVPQVAKVAIQGNQKEVIYVEASTEKMTALGISRATILKALQDRNLVVPSGNVRVSDRYIAIEPTGTFNSITDIENLRLQSSSVNKSDAQIRLRDIAKVTRGYTDPPHRLWSFNGKPAIGLGISIVSGGNVVKMGEAVKKKLQVLKKQIPLGIEFGVISFQSDEVNTAVDGFIGSLLESLAIVIAILLIFMGWRSGLIIALVLLLTIFSTFIFMYLLGINLERISLGALIISLGMLVDNAIVVTEGILISTQQGQDTTTAAKNIVKQTQWPLFGATLVAILAFAGIGLSQDATGEYCRSLFFVILISLMMSWLIAITITPFLCVLMLKIEKKDNLRKSADPYRGFIYQAYKRFLVLSIKLKWVVCIIMLAVLVAALMGFQNVKQSFFPDSTRPQFYIDYWLPEGTNIEDVYKDLLKISNHINKLEGVTSTAAFAGEGTLRFMLTYVPEKVNSSYGFVLISVDNYKKIDKLIPQINEYLKSEFPNAQPEIKKFILGTGGGASIIARFLGDNPAILRSLSTQTQEIMRSNSLAKNVKDNWRNKVPMIFPIFDDAKASAAEVTIEDLRNSLNQYFTGASVAVYREGNKFLPIISRAPCCEHLAVSNINNVSVWNATNNRSVPIRQVVNDFKTNWNDSIIHRRERSKAIEVMCDPKIGTANALLLQIKSKIEAITLPLGYELEWAGEYGDSRDAKKGLRMGLIFSFLFMIIIVIILFNSIRQPIIIFATLPLAIIGITIGLLVTDQPFGFMALLGALSLSGMIIKNGIILIDQIDLDINEGKNLYSAVVDSSVSRLRPILMAAVTTILGMIPLLKDAFFISMSVTIMFGLAFATLLTLVVVPVLYYVLFCYKRRGLSKPCCK